MLKNLKIPVNTLNLTIEIKNKIVNSSNPLILALIIIGLLKRNNIYKLWIYNSKIQILLLAS